MTDGKKPKKTPTYSAAAAELDEILEELEDGSIDIDVLSEKVERASWLVQVCREKLAGTELKVTKVLEQLEQPADEEDEDD